MSASPKDVEVATVIRQSARVGTIKRSRKGSVFAYDTELLERMGSDPSGVAFHLPYADKRFETVGVNLHTFFAGLLPEGRRMATLVRRLKTSPDDLLSLLIAAGTDCVGDISVVPEGESVSESVATFDVADANRVRFRDLFERSLGPSEHEPTIPGVQEKISAAMISFPITTARRRAGDGGRSPISYILKLNPSDKPRLVENEDFFLRMAAACRLDVARAEIIHDVDGASGLLVERFDRVGVGPIRVHQEDACQFLDRYPADKYRLACKEIAEGVVMLSTVPIVEMTKLIRLFAFSYVIGNGDLHAKNVSLRIHPTTGRVELTPAYDLLSTIPYGDRKMALALDGRDDNLKRRQFEAFGERHGVRRAATAAILDEIYERSEPWLDRLDEIGLDARRGRDLRGVMVKRRGEIVSGAR